MTELHKNRFKFESTLSRTFLRAVTTDTGLKFDIWLFRWTGVSILYRIHTLVKGIRYYPHMLLTTIGAKTGLPREAMLPFFREGDDYVIIGSNAGADKDPAWINNLRANPRISANVARRVRRGTARFAEGELRNRLYAEACRMNPIFINYAKNTPRVIPVVLLTLDNH